LLNPAQVLRFEKNTQTTSRSSESRSPSADDLTDRLSASFFGAPQQSSYALFDCVRVSALGGAYLSSDTLIESKGLKSIQDSGALEKLVDEVLAQNPEAVAKIKEGNKKPVDFLIGQVMKKTRGKADPAALTTLIQKKLRS
jgi:hypothetical protein